jgi:hypothetical protein
MGPSPTRGRRSYFPFGAARDIFLTASMAFIVVWNIGLWYDAKYVPPAVLRRVGESFSLHQRWGMFARLPSTGWIEMPGTLRDGSTVNLFAAGGPLPDYDAARAPLPREEPALPSSTFASVPWVVYFLGVTENSEYFAQMQGYGRYLCRTWNEREEGPRQLKGFELIHMRRPVDPVVRSHPPAEFERASLWVHNCFG